MYSFEMTGLDAENIQDELLGLIENSCEQFHLQDFFGIISTALHEIVDQILQLQVDNLFSLSVLLNNKQIRIQIHQNESLLFLKERLEQPDLNTNPSLFVSSRLADQIEFDDDQTIILMFHVKPYIHNIHSNREGLLLEGDINQEKLKTKR